jgi:hypothetical protein
MKQKLTGLLTGLILATGASAQDLDPRAYVRVPVDGNVLVAGFSYSHGGVVTDPSLPLEDLKASVEMITLGLARSFSFFGMTAQAFGVIPFAWVQANALVTSQYQSTTRTGFSDMRFRLSVLLHGAPAATREEFVKSSPRTIIGSSLTIVAPTGQYFPDKLINLGTSRWSFKPEVALSHPMGKRWMMDVYAGVWLFTTNYSFYPGTSVRRQDPLGAIQAHLSYTIKPGFWAAADATFYAGGNSTVNDVVKDDRQSNSRIGLTVSMPVGKINSVKIACSTGAVIRFGANFTSVSVSWQTAWFKKAKD